MADTASVSIPIASVNVGLDGAEGARECEISSNSETAGAALCAARWEIESILSERCHRCLAPGKPKPSGQPHNCIDIDANSTSVISLNDWPKPQAPFTKQYLLLYVSPRDGLVEDWLSRYDMGTNLTYCLTSDSHDQWVGTKKMKLQKTDLKPFLVLNVEDFASGIQEDSLMPLYESCCSRILKSSVNLHSKNFWGCSPDDSTAKLEKRVCSLMKEDLMLKHLSRPTGLAGPTAFFDAFDIRPHKGLVDSHDMDHSCALLIGEIDALESYISSVHNPSEASSLHVVPFQYFATDSIEELAEKLNTEFGTSKVKIGKHLKNMHAARRLNCSNAPDVDLPFLHFVRPNVESNICELQSQNLGFVVCKNVWPDRMEFEIPGGKRHLGETPLECVIRETYEESGIDVRCCSRLDGQMWATSEPSDFDWVCVLHTQATLNNYYLMLKESWGKVSKSWKGVSALVGDSSVGHVDIPIRLRSFANEAFRGRLVQDLRLDVTEPRLEIALASVDHSRPTLVRGTLQGQPLVDVAPQPSSKVTTEMAFTSSSNSWHRGMLTHGSQSHNRQYLTGGGARGQNGGAFSGGRRGRGWGSSTSHEVDLQPSESVKKAPSTSRKPQVPCHNWNPEIVNSCRFGVGCKFLHVGK